MKRFLGPAFFATALTTTPAMAADNDITGLLYMRSFHGDVTSLLVPGIKNTEQCLALAWTTSRGWERKIAEVTCLQDGNIIAAQSCNEGNCIAMSVPSIQPK